MAQTTIELNPVWLETNSTATAYSPLQSFTVPPNAGINSVVLSFSIQNTSGSNTRDRAVIINGQRAYAPWVVSGVNLDKSLFAGGTNTFRMTLASQNSTPNDWAVASVTLVIDYVPADTAPAPIPPSSDIALDKYAMDSGSTVLVRLTGAPDVYHRLTAYFYDYSTGIVVGTGASHDWYLTIPHEWMSVIPAYGSGTLRVTMEAFSVSDNTMSSPIRVLHRYMTINVISWIKPVIEDFRADLVANGVPAAVTGFVQGYSKAALSMDGVFAQWSTLVQSGLSADGFTTDQHTATIGPFAQSGEVKVYGFARDARGRETVREIALTVLPYSKPTFHLPAAFRSDALGAPAAKGGHVTVQSGVSYAALNGENQVTLYARVYQRGTTPPAYTQITPGTPWTTGGGSLLSSKSYVVDLKAEDLLDSTLFQTVLPTDLAAYNFIDGVLGGAVGKMAEIPGVFESAWPIIAPSLYGHEDFLDNTDWADPVNVRQVAGTLTSTGYCIDRWINNNSNYPTLEAGYIHLPAGAEVEQRVCRMELAGSTVTIGVMTPARAVMSGTGAFPQATGDLVMAVPGFGTITLRTNTASGHVAVLLQPTAGISVMRVKGEVGSICTMAWDGPMRRSAREEQCAWYLELLPGMSKRCQNGFFFYDGGVRYRPKRIVPTVTIRSAHDGTAAVVGQYDDAWSFYGNAGAAARGVTDRGLTMWSPGGSMTGNYNALFDLLVSAEP